METLIGRLTVIRFVALVAGCAWMGMGASLVQAQAFNSGSTGANGAYNPTCSPIPCTVNLFMPASGVFNFTTVTIPGGVTAKVIPNAANTPVIMLATGTVSIQGTLDLRGQDGQPYPFRALGGPGGFAGGEGATPNNVIPARDGTGPGGGRPITGQRNGQYGASASFVSLIPLVGGSGGAGGIAPNATTGGTGGGGGGGAIVIASNTAINVLSGSLPGSILANGGNGSDAGGGSGGSIRLVAPSVTCGNVIQVRGGNGQSGLSESGRIRVEATSTSDFSVCNTSGVVPSVINAPGPITPASTPPLVNIPTLAISSVGGVALPASPVGSYGSPDATIPTGVSNPVQVVLTASNTPVPTTFNLQVVPQSSAVSRVTTTAGDHTGTFASSTVTTTATLPPGEVSLLVASATFVITPSMASLFPLIDGEPADQILVAAAYGEPSTMMLVSRLGKELPVSQLSRVDQLKVAMAFEAMNASQ